MKGQPLTLTEPMDFQFIMNKQISLILDARHEVNKKRYVTDVQGLEFLLRPFWDKGYRAAKKRIDNGQTKPWKTEDEKWEIESQKANERFMELMMLISRSGLMPLGKFIEVWE